MIMCVCMCTTYDYPFYDMIFIYKTAVCLIKTISPILQQAISLEWRILTRDCVIYLISVAVLVIVMWDGIIKLYEAVILMVLFVSYLTILFSNKCIARWLNKFAHLYTCKTRSTNLTEEESKCHCTTEYSEIYLLHYFHIRLSANVDQPPTNLRIYNQNLHISTS